LSPITFDLTDPDTMGAASFQATAIGDYEIQVVCVDACGAQVVDTLSYSLSTLGNSGTGTGGPGVIGPGGNIIFTQGACIADLTAGRPVSFSTILILLSGLSLLFLGRLFKSLS
ncbi:MAG: hypothetical protein KDK66_03340, partial [Deltaproteobacteria bacterium]|nr:hypothetical protein [Deltaproteobacteria bacterium]